MQISKHSSLYRIRLDVYYSVLVAAFPGSETVSRLIVSCVLQSILAPSRQVPELGAAVSLAASNSGAFLVGRAGSMRERLTGLAHPEGDVTRATKDAGF
jgi:hypothetical protein